eukprot:1123746-Pelagomonas_calceolata.AAC.2
MTKKWLMTQAQLCAVTPCSSFVQAAAQLSILLTLKLPKRAFKTGISSRAAHPKDDTCKPMLASFLLHIWLLLLRITLAMVPLASLSCICVACCGSPCCVFDLHVNSFTKRIAPSELLRWEAACKLLGMSSVTPGSGSARSNRSPGAAEPAAAAAAAKTTSRVPRLLRKSAPSCAPISSPLASRYQAPHEGQRQQPQQQFSQQHGLEPHAEGPRDRAHGAACPKASTPVRHYLPIMGAATQCDISMHLRALAYGA